MDGGDMSNTRGRFANQLPIPPPPCTPAADPGRPGGTRAEHLRWAKVRALALCNGGDTLGAFDSFASDLGKHPELADHPALEIGVMLRGFGQLDTASKVRDFVEGCH